MTTAPSGPDGGLFVALEGGEGAGKSTQASRLVEWLRGSGHEVVVTREPGATAVGARVRELLLDPGTALGPHAEALLYAADRAEHVATVIRPALQRGAVVVSDRYIDSSIAYQGFGRGLEPETVAAMSRWATGGLLPDLTVLLDLPVGAGRTRLHARGGLDRMEAEADAFHERVRQGFGQLAAAEPARYTVLDATGGIDQVAQQVRAAVQPLLTTDGRGGRQMSTGTARGRQPR